MSARLNNESRAFCFYMAFRSSSSGTGTNDTPTVTVPVGAAKDDIVILTVSQEAAAAADFVGKYPAGFTALNEISMTSDGQGGAVAWKRLTAADSGSYTFTALNNGTDWLCQAFCFSQCHLVNAPTSGSTIQNTAQSSPVTITVAAITPLLTLAGDDLLWVSLPDVGGTGNGNGHTPPPSFTEQLDTENGWTNLSGATRENVGGGLASSISGTFLLTAGTAGWACVLVRIPAAPGYRGYFLNKALRH